jgi:hypothetical protein
MIDPLKPDSSGITLSIKSVNSSNEPSINSKVLLSERINDEWSNKLELDFSLSDLDPSKLGSCKVRLRHTKLRIQQELLASSCLIKPGSNPKKRIIEINQTLHKDSLSGFLVVDTLRLFDKENVWLKDLTEDYQKTMSLEILGKDFSAIDLGWNCQTIVGGKCAVTAEKELVFKAVIAAPSVSASALTAGGFTLCMNHPNSPDWCNLLHLNDPLGLSNHFWSNGQLTFKTNQLNTLTKFELSNFLLFDSKLRAYRSTQKFTFQRQSSFAILSRF